MNKYRLLLLVISCVALPLQTSFAKRFFTQLEFSNNSSKKCVIGKVNTDYGKSNLQEGYIIPHEKFFSNNRFTLSRSWSQIKAKKSDFYFDIYVKCSGESFKFEGRSKGKYKSFVPVDIPPGISANPTYGAFHTFFITIKDTHDKFSPK